ncbi:sulfurtransferase [Terribacillus sp. DMT04]|uniref:sulfurtransferase n=1 Tax=Terribacillus sp. DMT04 TaxID=2850441 RepID=UPI00352E8676
MSYKVNKEWLYEQLHNPQVRIVDCRFELSEPDKGENLYNESHIPGSVYFDLDKQLSGSVEKHGGRHPLPDMKHFQAAIEKAGIDNTTTVIAYDDNGGQFAARFWWLLMYAGHERVYILDGGLKAGLELGTARPRKCLNINQHCLK